MQYALFQHPYQFPVNQSSILFFHLGVIHKLRHLIGGGGGLSKDDEGGGAEDDVIFWYTKLVTGNKNIMLSATYMSSHIQRYVIL